MYANTCFQQFHLSDRLIEFFYDEDRKYILVTAACLVAVLLSILLKTVMIAISIGILTFVIAFRSR